MLSNEMIIAHLSQYKDPYTGLALITTNAIKALKIENNTVILQVEFGFPIEGIKQRLSDDIKKILLAMDGVKAVDLSLTWKVVSHAVQSGIRALSNVKNIIAVASGKGGVGKSTTAVNLALALQGAGAAVGILDADIYGPSQPQMLGNYQKPVANENNSLSPLQCHGLQAMSIGNLIDKDKAVVWRGPMVSGALQQLLTDTNWQNLDYLIIDLPPGTGDIQLTLCQKIPLSGAIVVTTPQDLALLDVSRAIAMFNKVKVPVLGIVENMSIYICKQCGHQEHLFGKGGGKRIADQYGVNLLGQLPLDYRICEQSDKGLPFVLAEPEHEITAIYRDIAYKFSAKLSQQVKDFSKKFPKIVIENK